MDELFYRPITRLILARQPKSALDYGCRDGWLAERLSREGVAVTGYDPDAAMIQKCRERGSPVEYGGMELMDELRARPARFDAVICSRVLCTIESPAESRSRAARPARVCRVLRVGLRGGVQPVPHLGRGYRVGREAPAARTRL